MDAAASPAAAGSSGNEALGAKRAGTITNTAKPVFAIDAVTDRFGKDTVTAAVAGGGNGGFKEGSGAREMSAATRRYWAKLKAAGMAAQFVARVANDVTERPRALKHRDLSLTRVDGKRNVLARSAFAKKQYPTGVPIDKFNRFEKNRKERIVHSQISIVGAGIGIAVCGFLLGLASLDSRVGAEGWVRPVAMLLIMFSMLVLVSFFHHAGDATSHA
jgi:hypothetical protein